MINPADSSIRRHKYTLHENTYSVWFAPHITGPSGVADWGELFPLYDKSRIMPYIDRPQDTNNPVDVFLFKTHVSSI